MELQLKGSSTPLLLSGPWRAGRIMSQWSRAFSRCQRWHAGSWQQHKETQATAGSSSYWGQLSLKHGWSTRLLTPPDTERPEAPKWVTGPCTIPRIGEVSSWQPSVVLGIGGNGPAWVKCVVVSRRRHVHGSTSSLIVQQSIFFLLASGSVTQSGL